VPGLVGPDGRPISSARYKKGPSPVIGPVGSRWSGREDELQMLQLPGGGYVQIDLNKLTMSDFRNMRDHYQVNVSLSVLSFMQHQSDFTVKGGNDKQASEINENLHDVWTQLNRSMSQANWAGYSPSILEFENDVPGRRVYLDKVKDLIPEECWVNWKKQDAWAPPGEVPQKINIFDGIRQARTNRVIPVSNSFWYPSLWRTVTITDASFFVLRLPATSSLF
jgi:hypothetical protein